MNLAYVSLPGRGLTDLCLGGALTGLLAAGIRVAGTVQSDCARPGRAHCDMDLRVLPDGPVLRISQDLGALARGCRLDADGLEAAVTETAVRLPGAHLLMVNKFGKQEGSGRGFVPVIAEALDRGLPVLVGVYGLNLPAFQAFAGGLAVSLPPDPAAIVGWARAALGAVVA